MTISPVLTPDLNVVTVVDPQNTAVEMRPCEILQVIFTDRQGEVTWIIEQQKSVPWKPIRHETYYHDGFERYRENFQVLNQNNRLGTLQNHYWFRISPKDCKKVMDERCGYSETTTLAFYETIKGDKQFVGRLKIFLVMESEDKDEFLKLSERLLGNDSIAKEAQLSGVSNRLIDEENGYILNPGWDEQIMFETRQRMMMVELAEPPDPRRKWSACANASAGDLSVTEMTPRYINGVRIQRFRVTNHVVHLAVGLTKMRIGDVYFRVSGEPKWDKKINFFVSWERKVGEYIFDSDEDEEAYYWMQHIYEERRRKPRKVPVKIEELDVKGDLKAGAKILNVFTQRKRTLEIADPADNSIIHVPPGEELVIMLYKDPTVHPPRYEIGSWSLEHEGTCVRAERIVSDHHHQRFVFTAKSDPSDGETLTFKMRDRVKQIHITCSGLKGLQEVKKSDTGSVSEEEMAKIMNELLNNPTYHWRTVTSLSKETDVAQVKVVEALDIQAKEGKVIQHPESVGLWGHKDRVRVGIKRVAICGDEDRLDLLF